LLSGSTGEQQHWLVLDYEHGLTHEELAVSMGYSLGTVKTWEPPPLCSLR